MPSLSQISSDIFKEYIFNFLDDNTILNLFLTNKFNNNYLKKDFLDFITINNFKVEKIICKYSFNINIYLYLLYFIISYKVYLPIKYKNY